MKKVLTSLREAAGFVEFPAFENVSRRRLAAIPQGADGDRWFHLRFQPADVPVEILDIISS